MAAREAYDQAIALEIDPAVRRFLQKRRAESLAPANPEKRQARKDPNKQSCIE